MGRMSKKKGARGELEAAKALHEVFPKIEFKRGVQYAGSKDSPDVSHNGPGQLHIEVKRSERFRAYDAMEQAVQDAGEGGTPIVVHRQNNKPWLLVIRLEDVVKFIKMMKRFV